MRSDLVDDMYHLLGYKFIIYQFRLSLPEISPTHDAFCFHSSLHIQDVSKKPESY